MIKFSKRHGAVLALLTALAAPATFAADAWTEEGGNASGNAFNADQTLLGANTLDQMATLWSRFDLTDAYNVTPPVASDGQAFFSRYYYQSHSDVIGLDAQSGATLWKLKLDGFVGTPALTSSLVIVPRDLYSDGTRGGDVQAFDRASGELVWRADLPDALQVGSPHVADGVAYVSTADSVVALDTATGAQLWAVSVDLYPGAYRPLVAQGIVVVQQNTGLMALDAQDGHQLWRATGVYSTQPQIIVNETVLVQDGRGMVHAYDLATGALRWAKDILKGDSKRVNTNMTTDGQRVFAMIGSFDVSMTALDIATGETVWSRSKLGELVSPVASNGVIYMSKNHNIATLDSATGAHLSHPNLPGYEYGSLSLAQGRLFLVASKHLYALGLPQGQASRQP
jgi:outer membrane protein assembly factor BamB